MYTFDECITLAEKCKQEANIARNDEDKHSWLAMVDSLRKTAELRLILQRQQRKLQKVVAQAVAQELSRAS